ncbi:MAG: hypothetical protein FJX71_03845 [Alphaproteobacteria bacterium]|nr:hypothetical protein [Alphaproteobacteria bacterium]
MRHIKSLLEDFRLTTVEIIYHLPDHPSVLQSFVWQDYDLPPHFPKLLHFLDFWSRSLDGRLHSVHVAYGDHLEIPNIKHAAFLEKIH